MSSSSSPAGLAFIGHMCFDEVIPFEGTPVVAPGSAVLCGALAAARVGTPVTVVTRMAAQDQAILAPLRESGVVVDVRPTPSTTFMRVVHPSANVDEREMFQLENAGMFRAAEVPALAAEQIHLAGITDQEFDFEFVRAMRTRTSASGVRLSADMQSFVRQVDPSTRRIAFRDVPAKAEIAALLDMVKLDVVEAEVLTGTADLEAAARRFEEWGCPETVITRADGVLARAGERTYWQPFTNRSVVGRTGRGDTAFAAYMSRRLTHDPQASLRFAAALVSMKMEKPGPFSGTLNDVLERMEMAAPA